MKQMTIIILLLASSAVNAATQQTQKADPVTGAKTWETNVNGVHFSLTQILPDQLRAFYVNRGFSLEQIKPYVSSCVYMTVVRNDKAPGEIHVVRDNWSVSAAGKPHKLVPINQWMEDLKAHGAKKSSLIAFRWAQFPPEQKYQPGGNWNQGMLSIGLPPGSQFDITATWDISGIQHQAKLTGVQCAK